MDPQIPSIEAQPQGTLEPSFGKVPQLPADFIARNHYLDSLLELSRSDEVVVLVDGESGAGCTTLLAHFCRSNPSNTLSLFIRPATRLSYNIDYLRQILGEQLWEFVTGKVFTGDLIDEGQFRHLILNARKRMKGDKKIFIVVDGLHQIPAEDYRQVDAIVSDLLPLGVDKFSLIISGSEEAYHNKLKSVRPKTFTLPKFSPYEVEQYLGGLALSPDDAVDFAKLCRGVPGNLAAVKRLLSSGYATESILRSGADQHLDFLKLEFEALSAVAEQHKRSLAVLAFSRHEMTIDILSDVSKAPSRSDLYDICNRLTFIEVDPLNSIVSFTSDAHRRIAEGLLDDCRSEAINLQIEHLAADPSSPAALQFLPTYYRLLDRQQQLVDCLSADHYVGLLETTKSISALRARAALGARTANELRHVVDVFRFTMQRSIFGALSATEEFQSEVGALAALGLNERALDVATKAASNEARVALLAEYCRRVRERDGTVDAQVVAYIEQLAPKIDFSELGDTAISMAENLLFIAPDLALKIVDEAVKGSNERERRRDEVLAKMSMSASMGSAEEMSASERASSEISDESLQKLMSSLRSAMKDSSFKEILLLTSRMEIQRRIQFLRWIVAISRDSAQIAEVVSYALEQLVSHAEYVPKAIDLADLAIPLADIKELSVREALSRRIEGQIPLIEKSAPSKDLILLQVRLAHAEVAIDSARARGRLNEAYYELDQVGSIETKIDCLAIMLSALSEIDTDGSIERVEGFKQVFRDDLLTSVNALVRNGANQLQALRKAIRSIAVASPAVALDVADQLNNGYTRDDARVEAIRVVCASMWTSDLQGIVLAAFDKIADRPKRDHAYLSAARAIAAGTQAATWIPFIKLIMKKTFDPVFRCAICVELIAIIAESAVDKKYMDVIGDFEESLEHISSTFLQIELRYGMIPVLAKLDFSESERIYNDASVHRQSARLSNRSLADVITQCLALVSRSFRPLMKCGILSEANLLSFVQLVEEIPCPTTKVNIYSDLACKFWCERKVDKCREIVREKIRPILNSSAQLCEAEHLSQVALAFPSLYVAHPTTALHDLIRLSPYQATQAVYAAGRMILRRLSPGEPAADLQDAAIIPDFEDLSDLVELLGYAKEDWAIFHLIKAACCAISNKSHRTKLTAQQRKDLAFKFSKIAEDKIPDGINIAHEGYLITTTANIMRIYEHKSSDWDELFVRARAIENSADRVYILLEISEALPSRMLDTRKQLLAEARLLIDQLPSAYDRYSRLEQYIKAVQEVAPALAKNAFRDALKITLDSGHRDMSTRWRRNLVDLADSVSADLASLISEMSDDDPARAQAKADIARDIEVQKLRRRISDDEQDKVLTAPKRNVSEAAQKNLVSLIGGRMAPRDVESIVPYLNSAGAMYLADSYPILAWYIENAIRKCVTPSEVMARVTPLSEVILLSSNIALTIADKLTESIPRSPTPSHREEIDGALIIRPGQRQDAINYIRTWLRTNSEGRIILCDPYLDKSMYEFLKMVLSECPGSLVTILTSQKSAQQIGGFDSDALLAEWRSMSDDEPPVTEVIAVGAYANRSEVVIHDRWLISGPHALRMGTSFNSIGTDKLSELSPLQPDEAARIASELERYVRKERLIDNVRVGYQSTTL